MTNWQSTFVTANGVRLHYHRTGGSKPAVVLAHGITDSGLCWRRVALALAERYDVIMVDARGHGHSEAPSQGYAPEDHAADLVGLIQALDLEKPALVGHSMGAFTAATLAAHYPGAVRCLVLEDPPWRAAGSSSPEARASRRTEWREAIMDRKSQSLREVIASGRVRSPEWAEAEFEPWAEAKHQVSPQVVDFIGDSFDSWIELIPRIDCPTLLITGDPDRGAIVTPPVAEQIAALNDKIAVTRIPGAGHNIRRQRYDRYVEVVSRFLAEQVLA
jgi:N-formylmaleamate deformylase